MPAYPKPDPENSAKAVLTELAVEGTSSLVEAHRALLDLAQQENELILKGLKDQVSGFVPAAAMTDFVRRSVDAIIDIQHELLTNSSKQAMKWMQPEGTANDRAAQVLDFAREGVETFARAQKKFLDAVSEESMKAVSGRPEHKKEADAATDVRQLAHDAGSAFIEAQQRLLEVMNQQANVNLQIASRTADLVSPSQLLPLASLAGETIKSFLDAETALVGSLAKPYQTKPAPGAKRRTVGRVKMRRSRTGAKTEEPVTA